MRPRPAWRHPAGAAAPLLAALIPKAGVLPLDASAVSRDPLVVAAYRNDPLNYHGGVQPGWAKEFIGAGAIANGAHVGGLLTGWILGVVISGLPTLFGSR